MTIDTLYQDPDLARFYDLDNGWRADFDYCKTFVAAASSVLDLGCGTGLFAACIVQDYRCVVGVDPAEAMLAIARQRPGGDRVHWIDDDARTVRLGRRFDRIVLTGHAFQVFLTPEDRVSALRTIAAHLEPGGRFIFDTRNPEMENWKTWTPAETRRRLGHPDLGEIETWNDVSFDSPTSICTYETHYAIPDGRVFSSSSKIAFPSRDELLTAMDEAGLIVDTWLGDWSGAPFDPASSDMIPIGRVA